MKILVLAIALIGATRAQDVRTEFAELQSVSNTGDGEEISITLALNRAVRYAHGSLRNPNRIYVDLSDTRYDPVAIPAERTVTGGIVSRIRTAPLPRGGTRVVFDLNGPAHFSIVSSRLPPRVVVTIRRERVFSIAPAKPTETESVLLAQPPPLTGVDRVPELPSANQAVVALPSVAVIEPAASLVPATPPRLATPSPSPAAAPGGLSSRTLRIPRADKPPSLDDFIGREPSGMGVRVTDFRQREPGDNIPVSQQTTAYLSYDATNLYVVFVCNDQPGKVRGRMSKREDIADDDMVSVYLDTFRDGQHAYIFSVNPLGVQLDGLITEGKKEDDRFDTLWNSDGRLTPQGYVALLAIPFKSLRFSSESAQNWGIALRRSILRNNENSFWPYITRKENTFIPQMAQADGLDMIAQGRNIRMVPYGAFTNSKLLDASLPRYQSNNDFRGGLDSKFVLHNSLTLDTTVNPDFSQVESDDPQVTINQRYEVFFPEKRPFFIENINYFETPLDLMFTRRIIDPEFGARLTGDLGRWKIGALGIDDRAPGNIVDPANSLHGDHAVIGAARIQRVFGQNSNIGVLATDREFGASANRLVSADMRLRLSPRWFFTGQAAHSEDRSYDPKFNLTDRSGTAILANLAYADENLSLITDYQDLTPGFQAPLGYIPRVDIRKTSQYAGYLFRPQNSPLLDFGPSLTVGGDWDHKGLLQDWFSNATFQMDFKGPVGFSLSRYDAFERYLGLGFRYGSTAASFYVNAMKTFTFYGNFSTGTGLNYTPAVGLNPFKGNTDNLGFGLSWRPSKRARLDEYYYFTRLAAPANFASPGAPEATAFINHLARAKFNFQFTRALSFRGILDYNGILSNPALFNSGRYKTVTGDALLTYLLSPGTALYVGYNNVYQNLALDTETPPQLARFGPPDYMTSRQVFVKLSYLFSF